MPWSKAFSRANFWRLKRSAPDRPVVGRIGWTSVRFVRRGFCLVAVSGGTTVSSATLSMSIVAMGNSERVPQASRTASTVREGFRNTKAQLA